MQPHPRPVSLREVAREAGVSRTTASRALSGAPKVSREATEAVRAAAERLNYRADPIARALRMRTTGTIGMIVPVISNPFFAELVHGVECALDEGGSQLLLADSGGIVEQERRKLRLLVDRKVDGIIVVPCDRTGSTAALAAAQAYVPVIQVDRRVDDLPTDFVGTDDRVGMRLVADHLTALGVKSVVLVSADDENSVGRGRRLMFEEATAGAPFAVRRGLFHDFSVEHGRDAAARLLARGRLPEAIVCGSDIIAFGVISLLTERGVAIPGDTAVVGYDDTDFAAVANPPLTTVAQQVTEIAERTAALLRARLADPGAPPQECHIAPALAVRRSTTG